MSVVIPVYNEGPLVRDSILSVAKTPLTPGIDWQVIVVDDGSIDDTWQYIQRAVHEAKIEVLAIRNPENKGKRDALQTGFCKASGEVWITVDSDSIVEPDALKNGVSALVRDPKIGCVAGSVKVLNRNDSLITRFLKVSFSAHSHSPGLIKARSADFSPRPGRFRFTGLRLLSQSSPDGSTKDSWGWPV